MVVYKCDHCSYTTNRKSNLDNHLKRKNPCYVICQPISSGGSTLTDQQFTIKHKFKCSKCDKILSSNLN